jgi:hypothetical protein
VARIASARVLGSLLTQRPHLISSKRLQGGALTSDHRNAMGESLRYNYRESFGVGRYESDIGTLKQNLFAS